jgi:nitrite reductase (NADH) large subunit
VKSSNAVDREILYSQDNHTPSLPIVIVGNGPVGVKAAELLLEKNLNIKVIIYGEEQCSPYNRVQLSLLLSGEIEEPALAHQAVLDENRLIQNVGRKIIAIDTQQKMVIDDQDNIIHYHKLILATGSKPLLPKYENVSLDGVYQFRTLRDTLDLVAEKKRSKNFIVVGGGPLGLETALAIKSPDNHVTLQVRSHILNSHLGQDGQHTLQDYITAAGVRVTQKNAIKKLIGETHVEAVELEDGSRIICDCLIVCVGVRPQTQLAQKAGLNVSRGILVDPYMRTSAEDVYAIGECSEFESKTFGIVSPGFKQAQTCVEHILGRAEPFQNESANVQVKFSGYSASYFGEFEQTGCQYYSYRNRLKGIFRKLVVRDNILIGAVVIGDWSELNDVTNLYNKKLKLKNKWIQTFEHDGHLFEHKRKPRIKELPADYIICLCQNVTRGELSDAIESGVRTVSGLGKSTGAGTVCGSCQPMMMELLDTPVANLVMRHQKAILVTSIISLLAILLIVFFEPLKIAESVQFNWHLEMLWFDNFWKQVSGYTLMFICLLASTLVARKRIKKINIGNLDNWRYAHTIIGVVALLTLMVHTGMRLGNNLNFALTLVFLAAATTGSLVGVFMARNHHWSDFKLRKHRLWWSRVHYLLLWMLPPLICFHILSVYYF